MDVLIRFGFTIEEIKNMMDTNDLIDSIYDKEIYELIEILKNIGCSEEQIKNIFICNPFYLTRSVRDVHYFIEKLYSLGATNLNLLFDSNPYLLNMSDQELELLYNKKYHEGYSKEEILDAIYTDQNL